MSNATNLHEAGPAPLSALPTPDGPLAFFLDVDGTLVEIANRPEDVVVAEDLPATLSGLLTRHKGAVALVSGRPIASLDALFAPLRLPSGGQHGLEMRTSDGTAYRHAERIGELGEIERELTETVRRLDGLWLEHKGMTLAIHYRNADQHETELRAAVAALMAEHDKTFQAMEGKKVIEIKPRGVDKGSVVRRFMEAPPFRGRRPIFIGDDTTDENGFEAVNAMNGLSIQVGDRMPTAAAWRTPTVSSLHAWLRALAMRRFED